MADGRRGAQLPISDIAILHAQWHVAFYNHKTISLLSLIPVVCTTRVTQKHTRTFANNPEMFQLAARRFSIHIDAKVFAHHPISGDNRHFFFPKAS